MRRTTKLWRAAATVAALILILSIFAGTADADGPGDESLGSMEERVAREAADALGWPTVVEKTALMSSNAAQDETILMLWPPERAVRYATKPMYTATNGGSFEDETAQWLRVLPLGEEGSREFIDVMVENGLPHSSYQGRDAIVMRTGDKLCEMGGLLGHVTEIIIKAIEEFVRSLGAEPNTDEETCAEATAGVIMWTCGTHIFIAGDATGSGAEDDIAAALWMAAERNHICDLGDTLVLLAGTSDAPNAKTITDAQKLAQDVNSYYGQNAYGKVVLAYTFLDADGDSGSDDGYEVGPAIAPYVNNECDFAQDALKKAFEGGAPREEMNLARAIVVYSGSSSQADSANGKLSTLCCWPRNGQSYDVEVGPTGNTSHLYVGSLVMVAENDGLGLWAHEVGHSLYSQYLIKGKFYRISDRYNYAQPWGQYGSIDNWGLMGSGNWWGDPRASWPVQMSGFTKVSAEWLSYLDGQLDEEYNLTAIEDQQAGGTVLRIDDPTSNDPSRYFILEARDSGAAYGAPETGVVLYLVAWDAANQHHVVNAISAGKGPTAGVGPGNRAYRRPTLRGAGDPNAPTVLQAPAYKIEFQLLSESTDSGYSARVQVATWEPPPVVGAVAAPAGPPAVPQNAAPPNPRVANAPRDVVALSGADGVLPDLDLHAYDDQGRHVGLNYATGQYERDIPGAYASGDLKDAEEWIYVPEGTPVRFEISSYKTEQFLQSAPQYREVIQPQGYALTYQHIDENGVLTAAKGEKGEIGAGGQSPLEGPDAPGLKYKEVKVPGYGHNLPTNLWWTGLLVALGAMFIVGWIVALVRR